MQKLEWTGNIRELHNVVERLAILSQDRITKEDVQLYATTGQKSKDGLPIDKFDKLDDFLKWAEKKWIEAKGKK